MADRNEIDLEATRAPVILGGIVAASVVCTLFTAARLWVRGKILGRLHADDWLVVASVISIWVSVAIAFVAVEHGNGRHLEALNQKQQETVVFWTLVGFPFGILSFGLPKLAVVALLTRIMNPSRMHKAILWTMTLGCNVLLVLNALFLLGRCQPAESQWNFDIEGTCWDPRVLVIYAIVTGAYSAFIDFYLAVYPALTLSRLQMKRKKKIGLMIALGIGSASTAVAIYKCTRLPLLAAKDFSSWKAAPLLSQPASQFSNP
ncbi:hypothetical protein F5X68DRAFT_194655 [Plectosphaerella plurivora]|uniref:Rhodopsin domain-containing protein n=1 Tax=Plectosphaerella plurivora TaxID=936078 RepID=A0A9P9A758_9PEZI|nr:hypothetical protein F5X68DRAFT_194655 [Plectosphaerella plurivora]